MAVHRHSVTVLATIGLASAVVGHAQLTVAHSQGMATDQVVLADGLRTGDWAARRAAAQRIGAMDPGTRSRALIVAVVDEIKRVQADNRATRATDAASVDSEAEWAYYGDLLDIACASRDPIVLDALIPALGTGRSVIESVARFGDTAFFRVAAAVDRSTDPAFVGSAMFSLRLAIETKATVSPQARAVASAIVQKRTSGRQYSTAVRRAVELGEALGDPASVSAVTRLSRANTLADAGLSLVDPDGFASVKARANAALVRLQGGQ